MKVFSSKDINWQAVDDLLPVIVQNSESGQVLMLGYMNIEALQQTLETKKVTFYSRKRQFLWIKGETSGNYLLLKDILLDCDQDTLLILAQPLGPTCHRKTVSCFTDKQQNFGVLFKREEIIAERQIKSTANSYTAHLFAQGKEKIAQTLRAMESCKRRRVVRDSARFFNQPAGMLKNLYVRVESLENAVRSYPEVTELRVTRTVAAN